MSLNLIRTILENPGCAKGSSWALLIAMADRADDGGKGVYASMRVMAEICGISERTAWDALKPLLEAKIVIDTGNIHDWGSGHFTRVYDIDQSAILTLGMQALQKSAKSALLCGKRTTPVQNLQSRVQISHANQSLNQSPSPSAQEPSAPGSASCSDVWALPSQSRRGRFRFGGSPCRGLSSASSATSSTFSH